MIFYLTNIAEICLGFLKLQLFTSLFKILKICIFIPQHWNRKFNIEIVSSSNIFINYKGVIKTLKWGEGGYQIYDDSEILRGYWSFEGFLKDEMFSTTQSSSEQTFYWKISHWLNMGYKPFNMSAGLTFIVFIGQFLVI